MAIVAAAPLVWALVRPARCMAQMVMKTEHFTTDPHWDDHNAHSQTPAPATVTQNFGYKSTSNAGGLPGEVGGLINPSGEAAYYAKSITDKTFNDVLSASGTIKLDGGGNTVLGFFNTDTFNEWRSANSLGLRLYGRGSYFLAYPEYGTSKWRAGASGFTSGGSEVQFPANAVLNWSLSYDPAGNGGGGSISASIGNATFGTKTVVENLDAGHKLDGATFNHFGLTNVDKSYDSPGSVWIDNVSINGGATASFATNPNWDAQRNNTSYTSNNVRFRFNFGYSQGTNFAGGAGAGELGGDFFRGDSRQASTMAFYGDPLPQTLTLAQSLHAEGKVAFKRGVTDSTVHIGFFHNTDSVRVSAAQAVSTPEDFLGATIEGPSSEGFFFYPSYNTDVEGQGSGGNRGIVTPPYIYPNGASHDWTLDYNPAAAGGLGQIIVTLDGQQAIMNLKPGDKTTLGAHFNRFGLVTPQIDGNGQTVYFDDLTYTIGYGAGHAWAAGVSGDWLEGANWNGLAAGAPNGVDASAVFSNNNTSGQIVYANAPVTVGTLSFNSPQSWLIAGLGTMTLSVSSGSAQVNVTAGAHKINLPLTIASNTILNVGDGAQLLISDPVTVAAGKSLTQIGSGQVKYESTFTLGSGSSVSFASGAAIAALALGADSTAKVSGGADSPLRVDALSMDAGASLDVARGELIVRGSDSGAILALVKRGFNGGDWSGRGIRSSVAAMEPATALGVAGSGGAGDASDDATLVKYVYYGDADLSGAVGADDFARFVAGYGRGGAGVDGAGTGGAGAGVGWSDGDFDYSGRVDATDFERFLLGLRNDPQRALSADLFSAIVDFAAREGIALDPTSVPEPGAVSLFAVAGAGAGGLLRRGRRTELRA
jgi:hypothetical protein